MARNLNHSCKSFTGWNLILDEMGLPNVGPFFCGGLLTENSQTKEISYSGQYLAFKHFSPFMKREAKVLKTTVSGESQGLFSYPNHVQPTLEVCAVKNTDTCSNQAHFHHLDLIGVWKCVLLFIPVFPCCMRGSQKHHKKPYRVSGENHVNTTFTQKSRP